jgi:hypothetical protein
VSFAVVPKIKVAGRNQVEMITWQKRVRRICLVSRLTEQTGLLFSRSDRLLEGGFREGWKHQHMKRVWRYRDSVI